MMNKLTEEQEINELAEAIRNAVILNNGNDYLAIAKDLRQYGKFRKEEYVQKSVAWVIYGALYKTAEENPDKKITLSSEFFRNEAYELYGVEVDK